jgi:transposase
MSGARFVHDQLELAGWDVRIADAVKAKGLPDPAVRAERERARFRLHLVKHRTALKNRVHATLITHGVPNPCSDLFGVGGRRLLARLDLADRWRSTTQASLALIDLLDREITGIEREPRALGRPPLHPAAVSCPGIAWILAFTIASELGDIARFPVDQSGQRDWRGPLRKNGPNYLRWALVEAAHTALRHPCYEPGGPARGTYSVRSPA